MFDRGSGPPLVVIPGVQGRWEWMRPALRQLQKRFRTLSYTLSGDAGSRFPYETHLGFDNYLTQLDRLLDRKQIGRTALCGVSYGGFVALRYAATRPDRVNALILVSAPAPGWAPSPRQQRYIARPWRSAPAFVVTAPLRVWPEIVAALPEWPSRLTFAAKHGAQVLAAPMVPSRMARRVTLQQTLDFSGDCALVRAPTLVITGEDDLDRVVPPPVTRRFLSMIPGARYQKLANTGHIGMLTHPVRFAEMIADFLDANHH